MNDNAQSATITPLIKQYLDIKKIYPDTLVLFQVGDFYELFFDDAKKAAAFLGITLTARGKNNGNPIPLCGVPVHALDYYLIKLVQGGFRVAICNQLEEPTPGKVVERGITQVLTPGTLTDTKLLDAKSASYLFSFFPADNNWGLLFGELLTAQLFATVVPNDAYKLLESELVRFFPDEIIIPGYQQGKHFSNYFSKLGYCTTLMQEKPDDAQVMPWLEQQFTSEHRNSLKEHEPIKQAMVHFYAYLKKNQETALEQFRHINFYKPEDFLMLDSATQCNLELVKNSQDGGRTNTLFALMDNAATSMGSRMIKKWIVRPLLKEDVIMQRQDAVQLLIDEVAICQQLRLSLMHIGDLERIIGRMALKRASIHDYLLLAKALTMVPHIQGLLQAYDHNVLIKSLLRMIGFFEPLKNLLRAALNDDASKDWIINQNFDQKLDSIRDLMENSNRTILDLEQQEQQKTGIQSLKVRYNQVHGYYIEVTKPNLHLIPDYYIRHQTLVGKERFTIKALKELELEIMSARTEVEQLEEMIVQRIKYEVGLQIPALRKMAQSLANLDALLGLATTAYNNGYIRPTFNRDHEITISQGRHPVVEKNVINGFIPNDTYLSTHERVWIITGPNMGGKSTYLRQNALLCIMAQCGSFIPAKKADLPLLDRIFTRIGAGDNVADGKSTFLVEMEETALICSQATQDSLVILDEVGRGTSTFDGLAIAQAVVEYIYLHIKARCLFATHYHELTALSATFPGIVNYCALSKHGDAGLLLLHKIVPGIADGSFGIEIAKQARLPLPVIERAHEVLMHLKESKIIGDNSLDFQALCNKVAQLQETITNLETKNTSLHSALSALESIDYENLSPKKAFDVLWTFKQNTFKEQ